MSVSYSSDVLLAGRRERTRSTARWRVTLSYHVMAAFGLVVRLYLAYVWLRFGLGKIETGWLTSNQLRPLVQLVTDGQTHAWLDLYQSLSRWVLTMGADVVLAATFPLVELTLALAFAMGTLVRVAALVTTFTHAFGAPANLLTS